MDIHCFQLTAGDVVRYSHGSLMETCSVSDGYFHSLSQLLDDKTFNAELSLRKQNRLISHQYYQAAVGEICKEYSITIMPDSQAHSYNIPAGSAYRFSHDKMIETISTRRSRFSLRITTVPAVLFNSRLKSLTSQYSITNHQFDEIKFSKIKLVQSLTTPLEHLSSSKLQLDLF